LSVTSLESCKAVIIPPTQNSASYLVDKWEFNNPEMLWKEL